MPRSTEPEAFATIPMRSVGPLRLRYLDGDEALKVPLATFETPLWPSCQRGARLSAACDGIVATVLDERMTRSILLQADNAATAARCCAEIKARVDELAAQIRTTSRFAQLVDLHSQQVDRHLWLRLACTTGDASGHNMTTKAADQAIRWILKQWPQLNYGSISGNFCTDKKPSAVNGILGRGKNVIAELVVPKSLCSRFLKTTPEKIAALNLHKNWIGTTLAGGLRSANAHFANMLLACYLATGQDAANIVEGSQGFSHAEVRNSALHFSVTLPHLIVGTVGNGKGLPFVTENLKLLGCTNPDAEPGTNARRLAAICAAVVLCGELSLLAAQTNPGELMAAHEKLERS